MAVGLLGARRDGLRELERAMPAARGPGESGHSGEPLRRCIENDELSRPRDQHLLLLLASSGVLVQMLSRDERLIALRRLRKLRSQ